MHRIDGPGNVNGTWVSEDAATQRPPTEITPEWLNSLQEELASFVEWAGLVLAKGDNTQLRQALVAKFAGLDTAVTKANLQAAAHNTAVAGGTADAITAVYTPAITELTNGMTLYVRAAAANGTTTPNFTPADGTIAPMTIVKGADAALAIGDVAGAGHWVELQYDLSLDRWVLLNPATGISVAQRAQIQTVSASVASNAMTVGLNPTNLDFRSSSLTSGAVNTRSVPSALSLTIPSGASLGANSGVASRILILAIDNAGTVELAVYNAAGAANLDETGVISTTAISAAATAFTVYSQTARTNVPYRIVGYVDSTQATAGTWASAPTAVQGVGGQALAAMSSIGYGQSWQNVTGSRTAGTTYYNTTGKPITAYATNGGSTNTQITVGGIALPVFGSAASASGIAIAVIPPGSSYVYNTFGTAYELR